MKGTDVINGINQLVIDLMESRNLIIGDRMSYRELSDLWKNCGGFSYGSTVSDDTLVEIDHFKITIDNCYMVSVHFKYELKSGIMSTRVVRFGETNVEMI